MLEFDSNQNIKPKIAKQQKLSKSKFVKIPGPVTIIGRHALFGAKTLYGIELPDSVDVTNLKSFEIRMTNCIRIPSRIEKIGNDCLSGCSSLKEIIIPNSVTEIGDYSFCNCTSLTNFTIPNSVTKIGKFAFYNCSSFTDISIPNSVAENGDYAFWECLSLININIPNSVTMIGESIFEGCSSLTNITIPNYIEIIGWHVLLGEKILNGIELPVSVKSLNNNEFIPIKNICSFVVSDDFEVIGSDVFLNMFFT